MLSLSKAIVGSVLLIQVLSMSCQTVAEKPVEAVNTNSIATMQNISVSESSVREARNYNVTPTSSKQNIEDFMPQGSFMLAKAEGDLNADDMPDVVAVFSKSNPDKSKNDADTSDDALDAPRLFVIALRDTKNQLQLTETSEKLVLTRRLGVMNDEPLTSLTISDGSVKIEQWTLGIDGYEYSSRIRYHQHQWLIDGELELRNRRTGKTRHIKQKPMLLSAFDISTAFSDGAKDKRCGE